MATTIDELVVVLGLDPTNFSKGQREAVDDFKKTQQGAKKAADGMEEDGKRAARFFTNIKNEALSAIAVLIGAKDVGKFLGDTVTNLSAVGRIATVMGQATPDVLAVSMAVERIGGNAQGAQQSMLGLSQALERYSRFGEGSIEFKRGLGMVGAGPGDTPLAVLQKFATWVQGKKPQDVELIGQQIGLNQDLINLTIQGRKGFDQSIAQSYKNGIPTDADIKKVQALQQAFGNLAQSLKFAGMELVIDVADPLTHLLDLASKLAHDFPEVTKAVLALVAALITLKGLGIAGGVGKAVLGIGGRAGAASAAGAAEAAGGAAAAGTPIAAILAGGWFLGTDETGFNRAQHIGWDIGSSLVYGAYGANSGKGVGAGVGAGFAGGGRGGSFGPASSVGANASLQLRAAAARSMLESAGYSAEQARGVTAGLYAEFGLDPTRKNPTSTATGIAQWIRTGGRQALFKQIIGKDVKDSTYEDQVRFLIYELSNTKTAARRGIKGASNAHDAARAFINQFEAPGAAGAAGDLGRADRFLATSAGSGTTVTIGQVVVNTKATDAAAMARDVKRHLSTAIATQSNGALN